MLHFDARPSSPPPFMLYFALLLLQYLPVLMESNMGLLRNWVALSPLSELSRPDKVCCDREVLLNKTFSCVTSKYIWCVIVTCFSAEQGWVSWQHWRDCCSMSPDHLAGQDSRNCSTYTRDKINILLLNTYDEWWIPSQNGRFWKQQPLFNIKITFFTRARVFIYLVGFWKNHF